MGCAAGRQQMDRPGQQPDKLSGRSFKGRRYGHCHPARWVEAGPLRHCAPILTRSHFWLQGYNLSPPLRARPELARIGGMKKTAPSKAIVTIPTLSPAPSPERGEGVGEKCKTTAQEIPAKKPNWRCGAPNGNRNAAKTIPSLSTIRKRVRDLKRRVRAAIAMAEGLSAPTGSGVGSRQKRAARTRKNEGGFHAP